MSKFYADLRVLLIQRRITLKKLAEMTEIEYSLLIRRMQGLLKFTEEDIYKVCLALKIEPCKYFFGDLIHKLNESIAENN